VSIKLRHTAAIALLGWYLMTPPLNNVSYPDSDAPLKSWHLEKSFDSARECEAGRYDPYVAAAQTEKRLLAEHPEIKQGVDNYLRTRQNELAAAKCIASDDPRLKSE